MEITQYLMLTTANSRGEKCCFSDKRNPWQIIRWNVDWMDLEGRTTTADGQEIFLTLSCSHRAAIIKIAMNSTPGQEPL